MSGRFIVVDYFVRLRKPVFPLCYQFFVGYSLVIMAENKLELYSTGNAKAENVPVQVMTVPLIKDNYLQWYAAITTGIAMAYSPIFLIAYPICLKMIFYEKPGFLKIIK